MKNVALIVLVALLAYGAVLVNGAGFSHPDDQAASTMTIDGARPLLALTYAANRMVGGWMITNLALHVIMSILILVLIEGHTGLLAACLFAAHPMAADSVASVAGRSSILCAVFMMLAGWAFMKKRYWLILVFGGLAFFVKEEAVGILLLVPALAIITKRRATVMGIVAIAILALIIVPVGTRVRDAGQVPTLVAVGLPAAPSLIDYAPTYFSAIGTYIIPNMFYPNHLSPVPHVEKSLLGMILGFIFVIALVEGIVRTTLSPMVRIGCALILGSPLLPYAFAPLTNVFFDHRGYFALAGACVLMAYFLQKIPVSVMVVLIMVFTFESNRRAAVYATPLGLWDDARQKSPERYEAHVNYAMHLWSAGRPEEAEQVLRDTMKKAPTLKVAKDNLILMLVSQRKLSEATRLLDGE